MKSDLRPSETSSCPPDVVVVYGARECESQSRPPGPVRRLERRLTGGLEVQSVPASGAERSGEASHNTRDQMDAEEYRIKGEQGPGFLTTDCGHRQ